MVFFRFLLGCHTVAMLIWTSPDQTAWGQVRPVLDRGIFSYDSEVDQASIAGKLTVSGSHTMKPLVQAWLDGLTERHPNLKATMSGDGSKTGLAALLEHRTEIAALSHRMTASEISDFVKEYGYEPTEVPVAIDAVAVFVHASNPIHGLSLEELDAMFCQERRRGFLYPIDSWGLVGLDNEWFAAPIRIYGTNSLSGTSSFFRKVVCQGGPFSLRLMDTPGSASVIQKLEHDPQGIGLSSIGYRASYVKPVPIASVKGGRYVEPTFESAMDGSYPLREHLYFYVAKPPKASPTQAVAALVRFALSRQGQQLALDLGYYPLSRQDISRVMGTWSALTKAARTDMPSTTQSRPGS